MAQKNLKTELQVHKEVRFFQSAPPHDNTAYNQGAVRTNPSQLSRHCILAQSLHHRNHYWSCQQWVELLLYIRSMIRVVETVKQNDAILHVNSCYRALMSINVYQ